MPMFQMPELWMDHWVVWQQVARKLLPASRCCLKTGCVHTVCFMRLLPQAVDPQTRPCGRQRVMRSSTHCTSCWLRTPRATLTAGSPCHSLLPTHRFSPAAGGWGAAHGIRPPDAQHGALCPQLQAASARQQAGSQPATHPRHVSCAPWRAHQSPPPPRPPATQTGRVPALQQRRLHHAHRQPPCRTLACTAQQAQHDHSLGSLCLERAAQAHQTAAGPDCRQHC